MCGVCARARFDSLSEHHCSLCGQQLGSATATCNNTLCCSERYYEFNRALAMKTGELHSAIKTYKYYQGWEWRKAFASMLLEHLGADDELAKADMIIPMPAFPSVRGPRAPRRGEPMLDHAGWVIETAMERDREGYPFRLDPPVIIKTAETRSMAGASGRDRRDTAQAIYDALRVVGPDEVDHRTILVFDDVFTTGRTLNAVARRLVEAGADRVIGVTLARQPWGVAS